MRQQMVRQALILTCFVFVLAYAAPRFRDDDDYEDEANEESALYYKDFDHNIHKYFVCKSPNGRFPDPEDCSHYYECKRWKPKHKKCERNELFDPKKLKCANKKKVNCGGDLTTTTIPKTTAKIISRWTTYHPVISTSSSSSSSSSSSGSSESSGSSAEGSESSESDSSESEFSTGTATDEAIIEGKTEVISGETETGTNTRSPTISTSEEDNDNKGSSTSSMDDLITDEIDEDNLSTVDDVIDIGVTPAGNNSTDEDSSTSGSGNTGVSQDVTSVGTVEVTEESVSVSNDEVGFKTEKSTFETDVTPTNSEGASESSISSTTSSQDTSGTYHSLSTGSSLPESTSATSMDDGDIRTSTSAPDCVIRGNGFVPELFECPVAEGHFPHPHCDNLFIHCDAFKPYLKTCAEGFTFSKEFRLCVWPEDDVFKDNYF